MSANVTYCPGCGQPNAAGSQFCGSCGASMVGVQAPPPPQPGPVYAAPAYPPPIVVQKRGGGFPWLACAIVAAVLLCICGLVAAVGGWLYGDQLIALLGGERPGSSDVAVSGQTSLAVTSSQEGTVTTPGGARLEVPSGAVPLTDDGSSGTMIFSIEEETDPTITLPTGLIPVGPVYRLGPEGFTFALPVRMTLPIPSNVDPDTVLGAMFYDVADSAWKLMPAAIDVEGRAVVVETTHFSRWGLWGASSSADPWARTGGWLEVRNPYRRAGSQYPGGRYLPASSWYGLCIQSWSPDDPSMVYNYSPPTDWQIVVFDVSHSYKWWVPAGQYTLIEFFGRSEINNNPTYVPQHYNLYRPLGTYGVAAGQTLTFAAPDPAPGPNDPGFTSGSPVCWGEATTATGTGDVQITLTWNAEADIDLHVIDPNGDEVYYANTIVPSGGQLDRDNLCSNFIMGRPENIFWPSGQAPRGTYTVKVRYYSNCANAGAVEWTVRTVVMGQVNTYSGRLSGVGDEQTVTTFTVR